MSKYKVGDKFVIEIGDVFSNDADDFIIEEETLYKVKGFKSLVFDSYGLDKLQKYEEEVIATKFYEKGRQEALQEVQNCESYGYEKGLQDAWELARKICGNSNRNNNYTGLELESIFGNSFTERIIDNHTYQEALAKVEAYEKSQQIQVGDVVIDLDGNERVVLHIEATGKAQIFSKGGVTRIHKEHLKKTGRHIDIEHLLEQIRGNE